VLTLTPHIVRILDVSEADLRPFRMGRDAGAVAAPLPQIQVPRDQPEPIPVRDPTTKPAPAAPPTPAFPQPLQPPLPGTPVPILPPKPGGRGGGG
jgi:hypothetical protein